MPVVAVDPQDTPATVAPSRAPVLQRELGPIDATMIVVGSMIGSGIFLVSAETSRDGCSPRGHSPGS
jgi:hypothetical protein